MTNKKMAHEWLDFAKRDIETAVVLNGVNHYTDVIAIDIQQAVEKAFKAIFASNNVKVPRTHALDVLYNQSMEYITWKNISIKNLFIISDYYQTERYPGPKYFMPERDEINTMINLANQIIKQVEQYIENP